MTGIKVAILTPSASRNAGGLFNSVRRGAIEMELQGAEVAVFAPEDENCAADLPFWSPVDVSLYSTIGPAKIGFRPDLRLQIEARAPDIVHLHGLWTWQSGVTRALRQPVVISPRGMLDGWALKNSWLKKKVALRLGEAANIAEAACFHALNREEADAIRAFGVAAPIATIPNGIDMPEAIPSAPPGWLGEDTRKVLLFLGRIHPKKGLSELLRAWAALRKTAPGVAQAWRLVVGGWDDGGHLEALKRLVGALGIDGDVTFPGSIYHHEKHALLSHSDAFILPSYSEGLPMSVLEAWAYGLPVFMTQACNLSFAFVEGRAIEVTTRPDEIATTLAATLGQSRTAEIAAAGRAIAAETYGWRAIAGRQLELYDWLVGKRSRPDFVEGGNAS